MPRRDPSKLAEAEKLARMLKKWRPAGRRMRGEELHEWQRQSLRSVLQRHGLEEYYGQVKDIVLPTVEERTKAERKSSAARFRRAYGSSRDRASTRTSHGTRAHEYVQKGREAETAGHFATAAVWYKKAGAAYERAGNTTRARLWKARGKDVNSSGRAMGTLHRGSTPRKRRLGRRY